MRRGRLAIAVAVALPTLVGAVVYLTGALSSVEMESLSLRFDLRGERAPPGSVVLVAVDQATINDLQARWGSPRYPRRIWAQFLERMKRAGAGPVAFDLAFEAPTGRKADRGPADDRSFIAALRRYGRSSVAFSAVELPGAVPNAFGWLPGGRERFGSLSTAPGFVAYGGDGSSAGLVPSMVAGFAGYPTLGVAAARLARRVSPPEPDRNGELLVNFYGPPGTIPRVDLRDVLDPGVPDSELAARLRGRVVVIGIEDPTGNDRPRPTTAPGGKPMSGAEIHATVAANALDGSFLKRLPVPASLVLIAVMGLALPASALTRASGKLASSWAWDYRRCSWPSRCWLSTRMSSFRWWPLSWLSRLRSAPGCTCATCARPGNWASSAAALPTSSPTWSGASWPGRSTRGALMPR